MYVYGTCLFLFLCSDCVGVCGNICCIAAIVEDSGASLQLLHYSFYIFA